MHTQTNSKPRVKEGAVGDAELQVLFSNYSSQNTAIFRTTCKELIEQSSGKRETKDKFITALDGTNSKDVMLQKVTNYIMAGQGLGV